MCNIKVVDTPLESSSFGSRKKGFVSIPPVAELVNFIYTCTESWEFHIVQFIIRVETQEEISQLWEQAEETFLVTWEISSIWVVHPDHGAIYSRKEGTKVLDSNTSRLVEGTAVANEAFELAIRWRVSPYECTIAVPTPVDAPINPATSDLSRRATLFSFEFFTL